MSEIVLGVSESHNAAAALMRDGRLMGCVQEERITRKKNIGGFPTEAVRYLLARQGLSSEDVTCLCLANESPTNHFTWRENGDRHLFTKGIQGVGRTISKLGRFNASLSRPVRDTMDGIAVRYVFPRMRQVQVREIEETTRIPSERIRFLDHHTAHAWANLYFLPRSERARDHLVITSDGVGDRLSATISLHHRGALRRLESIPYHDSIALFYQHVTGFMGMKECEHEYKVMGLAPYSDQSLTRKALERIRTVFEVSGTRIRCKLHVHHQHDFLKRQLAAVRFDAVAAATQSLVEELTTHWVRNLVLTHRQPHVILGGGLFMNVKVNKLLREMPEIASIHVCPSCGDESCAVGACLYWHGQARGGNGAWSGEMEEHPSIYLGHAFDEGEIRKSLEAHGAFERYAVSRPEHIDEEVARLLARDCIVARFNGAMEFGARALGNRSILANPSNPDTIRTINTMIKNRDFWMPFALTMLDSRKRDYLICEADDASPYMMMTYDTTPQAQQALKAGLHPYDMTTRPQILSRDENPSYYRLIEHYESLTGIGAVLNTSFNLHGEPIVCSPNDALRTFDRSGLRVLALGPFLVEKRETEA